MRKLPSEKGKGLAGAVLIHAALFILLVVVAFSVPEPPEKEQGILVNFGADETGSGLVEPSPAPADEEAAATQPQTTETPSKEDALLTQNFDKESPEIKKVDPEAEKKKKEMIEAEKVRKAQLEAEKIRKAQEEAERKRLADEQKRIDDIQNKTKNAFPAKNTGTNSTGEGITGGEGNQGVKTGSVDSKVRGEGTGTGNSGISYELAGRSFQALPPPRYDYQGEGKVVVEITVDRSGNVTQANPGAKGSTTLDEYLLKEAKDAALKAKFEPKPGAPLVQKGTVTYNFILK